MQELPKKAHPSLQLLGKSWAKNVSFLKMHRFARRFSVKSITGGTKTSAMVHGNHFFSKNERHAAWERSLGALGGVLGPLGRLLGRLGGDPKQHKPKMQNNADFGP